MHKFNIKNIEKLDNPERRKSMPPEETLLKFGINDDGNLLDVGCGMGYFTIPAAKLLKNNKVMGVDILQEMVDIANEKAAEVNNIEFKVSREYSFPVENESIRYVLISNVMHEVEDKTRYMNEVKRVLKDEGYFLIIDWEKKEMEMGPPVQERISRDEMIGLCDSLGFTLIDSINISSEHYGLKLKKR